MNKKYKIMISTLICLTMMLSASTIVSAIRLGGKLINGTHNVTYTVSSGAAPYTQNINNAAHNWMYTGFDNPIYMTAVSSTAGSTIDIYTYNHDDSILAETRFFNSSDVRQDPDTNYWWCKVYINNKFKYDTSVNHDAVIVHEFGHVWGLAHRNNNTNSIMCQTAYGRVANKPKKIDNDDVCAIYGTH